MGKELLDLSTLVDRDTINIKSKLHPEGRLYSLKAQKELSIYDTATLESRSEELGDIDLKKKPSPGQARKHTAALRAMVSLIMLDIEPAVVDSLSDVQMLAIWGVYQGAFERPGESGEGKAPGGQTSAAKSRASKGSTVATP